MLELGLPIFLNVFEAVFVLFVIIIFSGLLVRKGLIKEVHIAAISHVTIVVLLPALMISKILMNFNPSTNRNWWIIPLVAIGMIALGLFLGKLLYFRKFKENKNIIAVGAFMNANYMVLPIGQMLFPDQFDEFATLTFLFILGVNPSLWSIGKYMVTSSGKKETRNIKGLLTPPFVATISSVLLVLLGISKFIPNKVLIPIEFLGNAAVPMATFVLGATLGSISLKKMPPWKDIIKINFIKLIAIPSIVISILYLLKAHITYDLLADILVLQASVAPASQLVIQIKKYGGDAHKVGNMMLTSYVFCLVSIPFWFTVWQLIK